MLQYQLYQDRDRRHQYKQYELSCAIAKAVRNNSPLRESLNIISYNGHHIKKMMKSVKTGWQCQFHDNNHSIVPEIVLSGKWLQRVGFENGDKLWILPFSELLIVIPQGSKQIS